MACMEPLTKYHKTDGSRSCTNKLEILELGNALGLISPAEFLAKHCLAEGDWLEVADRDIRLTRGDSTLSKGLRIAKRAMETYGDALAELVR